LRISISAHLLQPTVQRKNRVSGVLMEAGVTYDQQKSQHGGYFQQLLTSSPDID